MVRLPDAPRTKDPGVQSRAAQVATRGKREVDHLGSPSKAKAADEKVNEAVDRREAASRVRPPDATKTDDDERLRALFSEVQSVTPST